MNDATDLLIGLHADDAAIKTVAFDRDGCQIGAAGAVNRLCPVDGGGVEQDMGEVWQAVATSLRRLAEHVPDLARRTVALALTGQRGGTWLIDEDGDPVAPARLGCDRRAVPHAAAWRQEGVGEELLRLTGSPIDPSLQSVQLAWIARHEPELLAAAATALHGKDWLYFCCTGERATDPAEAVAAYGDVRRRTYADAVLDLLHLEEIAPLLPEIVDGTRHWGALSAAAAAATGLSPGTPVVLAPPDVIAIGIAAGIHQPGHKIGCTSLDHTCAHQQILRDPTAVGDQPTASVLPFADSWIGLIANAPGTSHAEWLIGMCEQFLADAGLIGMPRRDLLDLLEHQAAEATPGQLRLQPVLATDGLAKLSGLSAQTTLYDMMRAIYESLGFAARASFEALDGRPDEIRLAGAAASSDLCRQILAATVGVPVRILQRAEPAAAGAALVAAVALGHYTEITDGLPDWAEPHLGEAEPLDSALVQFYDGLFEAC